MEETPKEDKKDYLDKKNLFSNWISGAVAAMFFFIVDFKKEKDSSVALDFLKQHWHCYLFFLFVSIGAIFLFKLLGVYTAMHRVISGSDPVERFLENTRIGLFFTFLVFAVLQFGFWGCLLWKY